MAPITIRTLGDMNHSRMNLNAHCKAQIGPWRFCGHYLRLDLHMLVERRPSPPKPVKREGFRCSEPLNPAFPI